MTVKYDCVVFSDRPTNTSDKLSKRPRDTHPKLFGKHFPQSLATVYSTMQVHPAPPLACLVVLEGEGKGPAGRRWLLFPFESSLVPRPLARVGKDDSFRRKRTDTRQGQHSRRCSPSLALVHQAHVARRTVEVIQLHFGYNSSLGPEGGPTLANEVQKINSELWGTDADGITF